MPATLHLSTIPGNIERHNGYVAKALRVFDTTLGRETVTVSNVADVRAAVQAFGTRMRAAHPASSFLVCLSMPRSVRKPNGYDKAYLSNGFGQDNFLRTVEEQQAADDAIASKATELGCDL